MTEATEGFRPNQPEMPRNTEGELPEARIFDLLSSVGNAENKALELIAMREGGIYSKFYFYQEVMSHQTESTGWRMNAAVPFRHCEASLSPIGLVTREALSPDGTAWGYEITRYGIETGIPFAGLLLKWSYEHPKHSLYKMFGATTSTSMKDEQTLEKKRAQETRYKIFWEIGTNPNNRIKPQYIADEINENSSLVGTHLSSFSKNGIVSYERSEKGKSYSYFRIKEGVSDKDPKHDLHNKKLSTEIYNFITLSFKQRPSEYLSVEEIVDHLVEAYPEYEGIGRKWLSSRTAATLSDLERQGYVERKKFGYGFHSELALSDEQRVAIVSLVTLIDNFKNGDRQTIEEGKRFAQKVLNDSQLFSELMLKAKEASPNANQTNIEVTHSFLIKILHDHPNSTTNQIQQLLEQDYDKKLGWKKIHSYLLKLAEDGNIISQKTKAGNVYRVAEEGSQEGISRN